MSTFSIFPDPSPPRPTPLRRAHTLPLPLPPTHTRQPLQTVMLNKENLDPLTGLPALGAQVRKSRKKKVGLGERGVLGLGEAVGKGAKGKGRRKAGPPPPRPAPLLVPSLDLSAFSFSLPLHPSPLSLITAQLASQSGPTVDQRVRDLTVSPLADVSAAFPGSGLGFAFELSPVSECECEGEGAMDVDEEENKLGTVEPKDVPLPPSPEHEPPPYSTPERASKRARLSPSSPSPALDPFALESPRRSPLKRSLTSL